MFRLLLTRTALLLGIAVIATPTSAQEVQTISLRFVTFPVFTSDEPLELFLGEEEPIPIELPTNRLSKVYKIKNIIPCTLGRTSLNEKGKPEFTPFGTTQLLSEKEQIILVTRKGTNASDGLKLTPFNADQSGFGGGKYFMMNASSADIAGKLGETKFILKPNRHTFLSPTPSKVENNRKYLFVEVYFRKGDIARPFYTSTWRFSERARTMVFFHHDEHTRQLRTHSIRHYIEN